MLFSEYRSWLPGCVAGLVGFAGLTLPVLAQEAAEAIRRRCRRARRDRGHRAHKRRDAAGGAGRRDRADGRRHRPEGHREPERRGTLFHARSLTYFDSIQNQPGTPVIRGISQTNFNSPDRNVAIFYGGVYSSSTSGARRSWTSIASRWSKVRSRRCMVAMPSTARSTSCRPRRPRRPSPRSRRPSAPTSATRASSWSPAPPQGIQAKSFAASYNTFDGTYRNAAEPNDNLGGYETKNASGSLDFEVTDDLEVKLFGCGTDDHRDPGHLWVYDNNCGPNPMAPTAKTRGEIQYRPNLASSLIAEGVDREVTLGALDIYYQLGSLTFISQDRASTTRRSRRSPSTRPTASAICSRSSASPTSTPWWRWACR